MSFTIDLSSHGKELKSLYDAIISSDPEVSWAVFNYGAGASNSLRPSAHGSANGNYLADFVEEFDDGLVQYGFARVDYNNLTKFVLVGWVGEGVPERTKGYFNAHYATVAKYFHGYHVQITARSSADLSSSIILQKVDAASGSKYSSSSASRGVPLRPKYAAATHGAAEEDWGDAPPTTSQEAPTLTKVQSAYKPTKVDIASLKKPAAAPPVEKSPDNSISNTSSKRAIFEEPQSSYKPIGKVDIAALRAEARNSKFGDDRPTPLQSSYQPIGKVDIAAIRAQANANKKELESRPEPLQSSYKPIGKVDIAAIKAQASANKRENDSVPTPEPSERAVSSNYEEEQEDTTPKPVKERMSAFSGSGRLTELPKPKVNNSVSSRFQPATRGTAPSLPVDAFGRPVSAPKANAGFKDFGSEGGKTPAQLWAEKHAKQTGSTSAPGPSTAELIEKGSNLSLEDHDEAEPEPEAEEEKEPEQPTRSFADLTSRFAKSSSTSPAPVPLPPRDPIPSESNVAVEETPEPEREPSPIPIPRAVPSVPVHDETEVIRPPELTEGSPSLPAREDIGREESIAAALSEGAPIETTEEVEAHNKPQPLSSETFTAVVLYDYEKDEANELSLKEGEIITNIEQVDPDWWQGTNEAGESGLFPSNYVEITEPGSSAPVPVKEPVEDGPSAVAEYDYDALEEGELSFPEGGIITDIEFVDEAWWMGTYNGERGLLPANYVKLNE
ncbi:Abp1p [Sugiyamaella lignohabitans]|uniref:Abp1p n=1 Tax=Sugiyamaella lignohabitans TaxID=796027 RepID=A0A167FL69_9ASCO|nr:Abp1p [Sugiyamaella lignohabitans]ANB15439.1 Abp1p [Sugiyamaella lignohabitans]